MVSDWHNVQDATPARPSLYFILAGGLAGAVQAAAFLPMSAGLAPYLPAFLQALAVAMLLVCLHHAKRPSKGAWAAWAFSWVWLSGSTAWLFVSLHHFGGLPAWLAIVSIAALCGALSLYMAVAGALWVRWRRGHWLADAWLWAALWLLAELARAWIFTGFPWAVSGYALVDTPWVGLAPWLGVYGTGMAMVAAVAMVCLAFMRQARQPSPKPSTLGAAWGFALALLLLSAALSQHSFVQAQGQAISVALLQGNVPQSEKFDPKQQAKALRWHAEQLVAAKADLVVTPETAIPLLPADLPEGFWRGLLGHFHASQTAALVGVPLGSFAKGYTNSVVGISALTQAMPDGIYRYNKHHLVPFGEFIPFGFRWFVDLMQMPLGDFSRGPLQAPSFAVKDQWVAPNICYEDLFGEELAARFVAGAAAPVPTILANVSNLAWFGREVAISQHLSIARQRSLEFQRPSIRATNTGATVVINHLGQVTALQPFNQSGVLQASVQGMSGVTPFAWWAGRWGLMPLLLLGLALIAACKRR
jgi:apolipoprotein N-acyltransferase